MRRTCFTLAVLLACSAPAAQETPATWQDAMLAARARCKSAGARVDRRALKREIGQVSHAFPVQWDWFSLDVGSTHLNQSGMIFSDYVAKNRSNEMEYDLIARAIESHQATGKKHTEELNNLRNNKTPAGDKRWLDLFVKVCSDRRKARLTELSKTVPQWVFVKRRPIQPSFFAYTEGQSDAQAEVHFLPGGNLCAMTITPEGCTVTNLLDARQGVIRDLDVSYDGKRLLFAWKKSETEDDYHLYEMDYETKEVRQLTYGLGVADYEGIYLPDNNIMFSSSRCVQTVDCWWTEVSNMYLCDKNGKYLRRIGFDQVHTISPSLLNNGNVVYTRWDYNDRGQVYPQPLFQMNIDGTGQTEYYGNNSYFPTTINHARAIPGSDKIVTVLHGHHTWQAGQLAIIDRTKGTQEAEGVQLIAPVRETKPVQVDRYGQEGYLYRHPYALSETEFVVPVKTDSGRGKFKLYWVHADGNRELLHSDPTISCNNPMPLQPRKKPPVKSSSVDYTKTTGTYFMQDIYVGPGLKGVPRGTIKELRVVALEFRAAGVGSTRNEGEAGAALVSTPISIANGSWDVKKILGSAKVHGDGSAMFKVPAHTPVYFQALDDKGQVVQTMRSWSTLMPGEVYGCVGCHEDKMKTPVSNKRTMASKAGVQELKPFYGPARGFSYLKEIQPMLDKHCVKCHELTDNPTKEQKKLKKAFTLKAHLIGDRESKREWALSYLLLTGVPATGPGTDRMGNNFIGKDDSPKLNWISAQSPPTMLPPYYRGSAKSGIVKMLRENHHDVKLSKEEMDKFCAWIDLCVPYSGDYLEGRNWDKHELAKYLHYQRKREKYAAVDRRNTEELIKARTGKSVKIEDPEPRFVEIERQ